MCRVGDRVLPAPADLSGGYFMSSISIHSVVFACRPQEPALTRFLCHVRAAAIGWRRRKRDRDVLVRLRERDMLDLGVTRAELAREINKSFFRI
jgi:uncharacterized protein YjiS (DUF1127 family)